MPPATDGEIAVVKQDYRLREAYDMGHQRFKDADLGDDDPVTEHFKESATWANTVAPRLRAMAGLADRGHGTYQEDRQVAAVHPGAEEDEPAEAELIDARELYRAFVEAFDLGAYHAAVEDRHDPESVLDKAATPT